MDPGYRQLMQRMKAVVATTLKQHYRRRCYAKPLPLLPVQALAAMAHGGGSPRRMRMPGAASDAQRFPPVRGAEPPGPARAAWLSPRSAQVALVQAAGRDVSSPRVLHPQGAYY